MGAGCSLMILILIGIPLLFLFVALIMSLFRVLQVLPCQGPPPDASAHVGVHWVVPKTCLVA